MNNPYYTHRKFLTQELNRLISTPRKKFILELGVGDGSSEIFHEFAKNNSHIQILGLETDYSWAKSMQLKYELSNYKILYINNWFDELYQWFISFFDVKFDLIFVDQSPWEARIDAINKLYNKFDTLILHDYDYYNPPEHKYEVGEKSFFEKYMSHYNISAHYEELPPTLIMQSK